MVEALLEDKMSLQRIKLTRHFTQVRQKDINMFIMFRNPLCTSYSRISSSSRTRPSQVARLRRRLTQVWTKMSGF